ncbi:MAG: DNA repair protein RecO [Candidatus Accumulibacter sp.]|jgi:DNA repair protein RecO (recombination protein O)|nr:DNA repair protein RecO [Accumulibacter sp.]
MGRNVIGGQPAYVLHSHPYSETSLVVEIFSRDFGRIALLARGARRPRSALRGLLLAFQPLEVAWSGKGEVQTLVKAEWQGGQPLLSGKALLCAYYLNELLLHLLPRADAHEQLYSAYAGTLLRLADHPRESDLRVFECALLRELGYGLTLKHDADGFPIDPSEDYAYEIERGPTRAKDRDQAFLVKGKTLIDIGGGDFSDPRSLAEAKQLMRILIAYHTSGKDFQVRKFFMELQEL